MDRIRARFAYLTSSTADLVVDLVIKNSDQKKYYIFNLSIGEVTDYISLDMGNDPGMYHISVIQRSTGKDITKIRCKLCNTYSTVVFDLPASCLIYKDKHECPSSGTALVRDITVSGSYKKVYVGGRASLGNVMTGVSTNANTAVDFLLITTPARDTVATTAVSKTVNAAPSRQRSSTVSSTVSLMSMSMASTPMSMTSKVMPSVGLVPASGGVYTVYTSFYTHDNNASTAAPAQSCETYVRDFDVVRFAGKWNVKHALPSTLNAQSIVITPLWQKVKMATLTSSGTETSVYGFYDRVSQFLFADGSVLVIHKTDYCKYAIVGSPTRSVLYLLTRSSDSGEATSLKKVAAKLGYAVF